jgi:hypothetical protein
LPSVIGSASLTRSWVHGPIERSLMRRASGLIDLAPGAGTRIDPVGLLQDLQDLCVTICSLGCMGDLPIPIQAQPSKIFENLIGGPGFGSRRVEILDPEK